MVWDAIATTYFNESDTSQVSDLWRCVTYDLQGLWREIDFLRPNPMKCVDDIQCYNTLLQEERVYIFLDGLDDRLDKIRVDVLQMHHFPIIEQAYTHDKREATRQMVMITNNNNETRGAILASKSIKLEQSMPSSSLSLNNGKSGMSSKSRTLFDGT